MNEGWSELTCLGGAHFTLTQSAGRALVTSSSV
jgi:hypothetical protein